LTMNHIDTTHRYVVSGFTRTRSVK
jgi:hypothetical protein